MPHSPSTQSLHDTNTVCFGLRIESHVVQLAIAKPLPDGRYRMEIDEVDCPSPAGWLSVTGVPMLVDAMEKLVDRHDMRRHRVAVSLDGDFCVTRVTMGTTSEVDSELSMLADRIPRYLQLGPGEKVTGCARTKIAPTVDYAVTGVVNRSLIQMIYDALREADINVMWVEPSLVSVARLLGLAQIGGDQPVMIADGTGKDWDVGIACSGRLLLDYRPASATSEEAFRDALDGHISRLKRFCLRHRGVATGELNRLMICGSGEKPNQAVEMLGDSLGVTPEVLRVPNLTKLYVVDKAKRESRSVPAVATVLPLLIDVDAADVPDLLDEVRRAPELPWQIKAIRTGWPVLVALAILVISFGMMSNQRRQRDGRIDGRAEIQSQLDATTVKFARVAQKREALGYLQLIADQTRELDWGLMFVRITQSLPASAKLNEYTVESDGEILLDGTVLNEATVYELLNRFRKLPGVTQVALKGTSPVPAISGTRFVIRLTTSFDASDSLSGARHE